MTRDELVAEFKARGFDYMPTSRCVDFVNDAYLLDICEEENWPWLEGTAQGSAPLEISDLRRIEQVIDSTQGIKLKPLDRREITDVYDTDLTTTGTPTFYYLTAGSTVNVYPANTSDTLAVRYWKHPSALNATDEPIFPQRFHSLVVDAAVARAYEESDDYELAQSAAENFQARLQRMRESQLAQIADLPPEMIAVVDSGVNS